jgi:hypothetical protein
MFVLENNYVHQFFIMYNVNIIELHNIFFFLSVTIIILKKKTQEHPIFLDVYINTQYDQTRHKIRKKLLNFEQTFRYRKVNLNLQCSIFPIIFKNKV